MTESAAIARRMDFIFQVTVWVMCFYIAAKFRGTEENSFVRITRNSVAANDQSIL